jgi:hypothetical protein
VPGPVTDYLSISAYSSVSYQSYPIGLWTRTDSEQPHDSSLQQAWDNHTAALATMSALAASKGVANYATLQSFAGEGWRTPTPQENLCQVNLALAYGVNGILYWRYAGMGVWDDANGHTPFWYSVKNVVGPYFDKVGPIFASLNWQYAWKWGVDTKPAESRIIDITCNQYTNDPWLGDWLYLQVAEFLPPLATDCAKYFFLTNRRCLQEEAITGSVNFNGWACIGKSEIKTKYYATDMLTDSTWMCRGNPDGTGWMLDYAIPAGAGRLYQIRPMYCRLGDANADRDVDISDAVFLIQYIFAGGAAPEDCNCSDDNLGDANGDDAVDIGDAVFLIQYIFAGGPAPGLPC